MEVITFWSSISILTGACGGGFLLLLRACNKLDDKIEKEMKGVNNKMQNFVTKDIYKDINVNFTRKETVEVQFKSIEDKLERIQNDITKLSADR